MTYYLPMPTGWIDLADHIEIEHERELAPGATGLAFMHREMHRTRHDWPHTHRKDQAE